MVYYIFKEFQDTTVRDRVAERRTTVRDRVAERRGDRRKRRENFKL